MSLEPPNVRAMTVRPRRTRTSLAFMLFGAAGGVAALVSESGALGFAIASLACGLLGVHGWFRKTILRVDEQRGTIGIESIAWPWPRKAHEVARGEIEFVEVERNESSDGDTYRLVLVGDHTRVPLTNSYSADDPSKLAEEIRIFLALPPAGWNRVE